MESTINTKIREPTNTPTPSDWAVPRAENSSIDLGNGDNTAEISVKGGERALGLLSSDLLTGSGADTIQSAPMPMESSIIAIPTQEVTSIATAIAIATVIGISIITRIHQAVGGVTSNQAAKTMSTDPKANTQTKNKQVGSMNTQGPVALAYRLVPITALLIRQWRQQHQPKISWWRSLYSLSGLIN